MPSNMLLFFELSHENYVACCYAPVFANIADDNNERAHFAFPTYNWDNHQLKCDAIRRPELQLLGIMENTKSCPAR